MMKPICIGCGCDEDNACPMDPAGFFSCWWMRFDADNRVGICSCCQDLVCAWKQGERKPQLELIAERYYRQVLFLYDDEASALAWLHSPQPLLGGRAARDLILAGELERVQTVVAQIRDGAYI